jgi:hypothetical protein
MMPPRFPYKYIAPALLGLFFIIYYTVLIFSAKPQAIQTDLVRFIETTSNGSFKSSRFRLFHFPVLQTEFSDVELQAKDPTAFTFKARKVRFYFSFWAFVFAKAEISKVAIDGGEIHLPMPTRTMIDNLDIQNAKLRIRWNAHRRQATLKGEGDLEGVSRSLSGKAVITALDIKKGNWQQAILDGDVFLKNFPAAQFQYEFFKQRNIAPKEGAIQGQVHFHKDRDDANVRMTGKGGMAGLIYEVQDDASRLISPPMDIQADTEMVWNPAEERLFIEATTMKTPMGMLEASGTVFLATRELKDMRVHLSEVMLESVPQFYLPFKEAVPFHFGFSGRSDLEMSMQGTLDHLTIHANWDLTPTLLTYAGAFSKPKDMPLNLTFDCILKDGHGLSGDFSVRLQEAGLKGAIANLDLSTGQGQLNLMTNKFKLQHWAALAPPFQGYALEGEGKLLANLEGNLLQRPGEVKSMVNMTLDNVTITRGEDSLRNIYLALDYSPISLEIKEGRIQADDQPLFFNLMVYDPLSNPKAKANFSSQKIDAAKLLNTTESLTKEWLPKKLLKRLQRAQQAVHSLVPQGQTVEQLAAEVETKDNKFFIHKLNFNAYEGAVKIKGEWNSAPMEEAYKLEGEIDRLNLARLSERSGQKLLNGNLFLKGNFDGKKWGEIDWKNHLTGNGAVSITNGEFNTFSVLESVADIQGFSMLLPAAPETTVFDDLQAEFLIKEGKVVTEKATLLSRDFKASADGEVSLDGFLNYRLNVFLSFAMAQDILEPILEGSAEAREESFGPIPLLLSGTLKQPELATDPSKLAELKDNLSKKKIQKVLRNFLPEEALFKRLTSS